MLDQVLNIAVVPAAPGFAVFYLSADSVPDDADFQVFRHPVVAWRVRTFEGKGRSTNGDVWSEVEPLTTGGEVSNEYLVVTPDGAVEWPHVGSFETVAEALQHYRDERTSE